METIELLNKYPELDTGNDVRIKCQEFQIDGPCFIGDHVEIEADEILLGSNTTIEAYTSVKAINGRMDRFITGDQTLIGGWSRIFVPSFEMLDYSQLHNHCLVSGYKPITIGYNCWIGQHSLLNSVETLMLKNNVRIGTYSHLWTHVASGELLEGCTLYGKKPLTLEDNVWLVGDCVVSPGLVLGRNSIIMVGSIVTNSTEPFHTYAGIPAVDITEKLNCWKEIDLDQKFNYLVEFLTEFTDIRPEYRENILILSTEHDVISYDVLTREKDILVFVKKVHDWKTFKELDVSVFDLNSKRYIKKRTNIEIDWIKFSVGHRARFIPL